MKGNAMKLNQLMQRNLLRMFAIAFAIAVTGVWLVQDSVVRMTTDELTNVNRIVEERA